MFKGLEFWILTAGKTRKREIFKHLKTPKTSRHTFPSRKNGSCVCDTKISTINMQVN